MPRLSGVSLQKLFFVVLLTPIPFCLTCWPVPNPHELVQIVGEERPRPGHLQRVPQTFRGLVESIFVRLQGANDPFGLAALASDLVADGLGNAPRPVALGLDADLFTPSRARALRVAVAEPPRS